jgi:hypothetical protein
MYPSSLLARCVCADATSRNIISQHREIDPAEAARSQPDIIRATAADIAAEP